jgi:hypothetical protein
MCHPFHLQLMYVVAHIKTTTSIYLVENGIFQKRDVPAKCHYALSGAEMRSKHFWYLCIALVHLVPLVHYRAVQPYSFSNFRGTFWTFQGRALLVPGRHHRPVSCERDSCAKGIFPFCKGEKRR